MGLMGLDRSCTLRRTLLALIASASTIAAPRVAAALPAAGGGEPANPTVSESTGAASFRIPIAVPPGPGGFAPNLALSYSSRAGDGAFGVGWSLGLPEIRCSARFGVPDFASCQQYELGDTLLVAGAEAGRYHTVVESFQRIRRLPSNNSWTVEQPNGTKLFFGGLPRHRVSQGGSWRNARWLLQRMEDSFGNAIFFEYDRSDTGDPLPSSITYGATAAPTEGPRKIQFVYEQRTNDTRLVFTGGVERHLDRRLREIQVVSNGGTFRRYVFGYDAAGTTTNRSRLSWVDEFGTDCTATNPVGTCTGLPRRTFRYRDAVAGQQYSNDPAYRVPFGNYTHPQASRWRSEFPAQIGDLNGDGLPDRIEVHADHNFWLAKFRILINTGSGFSVGGAVADAYRQSFANLKYQKPYWEYQQIPAPMSGGFYESTWNPNMFAMCSVTPRSREATLSQELLTRGLGAKTSTLAQLRASNGAPSNGFFEPLPSFKLADLDADGLADLVVSTRLGGVTRYFDCNNPGTPLSQPQYFSAKTVTVVFRNTGSGWVNDAAAQALTTGLPPFEEALVKSTYQTEVDEPSPRVLVISPDFAKSPCANRSLWGFEQVIDQAGDAAKTAVCQNFIDLAPQFVDFNGDGYPDLAVLERDRPDFLWTGFADMYPVNTPRTHVWIQKPGASQRWQRAPQYDLPAEAWPSGGWIVGLAHAGLGIHLEGPAPQSPCYSWQSDNLFKSCSPNTYRSDSGVRLVDLNRDGLTDVVWSGDGQSGAFLNTGNGSPGDPSSAWCASEPVDVPLVGSACPQAAAYRPPAPLSVTTHYLAVTAGQLADLNGDGFLDFITTDLAFQPTHDWPAWIHDPNTPSASGASVWKRDERFDISFSCVSPCSTCSVPHPTLGPGSPRCAYADFTPRFEAFDINGDGADDVVGDTHAFIAQSRRGDLLKTVETGQGGVVAIEYASMSRQRDASLEAAAEADAVTWADDAGPVMLWRPTAVVSRVRVTGPNIAAPGDVTDYRYAHPRFSQELRSDLGFGLVQRTRPGGTTIEEYFYQDLGRTGRTALRLVTDAGQVVHRYQVSWEHVSGVIPGSTAGVYLARPVAEQGLNLYAGGVPGALLTRSFLYDDGYGYNFLAQVDTVRPSTETIRVLLPEAADLSRWIVGLVRERQDLDSRSTWASRSEFTYTGEGRLETELRHRSRGDGSDPVTDLTQVLYDDYGNLRSRIDANAHLTEFGYDETQSVLVSRTDPAVDGQPAVVTQFTPHPVFGVPIAVNPGYRDIPRTELVLDAFGRVKETWSIPRDSRGEGERVLVSATNFADHASPPYVEQFRYANADGDATRAAVVDDGFGGVWKAIRGAGTTGQGGTGVHRFVGSATYHDPMNRISRTTDDLPCATNATCSSLTGAENPATVTLRDALGRPIRVDTPRGASLSHYTYSFEQVAEGHTRQLEWVDVAWSQNAKGDLTRRSLDGDRVLAVEECTNSDPNRTSLADASCARDDGPNRTLYGYHASGQLEVIHDPLGVDGLWNGPRHQLRYHFDTAGQVIAIDDPDAGHSETFYDGAGNVAKTINARGQQRVTQYDPLNRRTRLSTPEGDVTFRYRAEERQLEVEKSPGYSKSFAYDAFGRVSKERMSMPGSGVSQTAFSEYDLLGRRTAITATGATVQYEYVGAFLHRVCSVPAGNPVPCADETATAIISGVTYDELGRRSAVQLPGGVRNFTYADGDDTRDLREDRFEGASTLSHEVLTRDPLGNALTWSTAAQPSGLNAAGAHSYDARNRLASWTRTAAGLPNAADTFAYDELGNLVSHRGQAQVFDHPTKPHAVTRRGAKAYTYDDSGNRIRAGNRHFTFDSADRLRCVGLAAGGCDLLRVVYDAAGERIFEQAGGTRRGFIGPYQVLTLPSTGGEEQRLDILAFGERVAYTISQKSTASASLYVFEREVPPWLLGVVPLAVLAWCLGLAIRGGLLVGIANRPGCASVAGLLIVSLAIPYPALAGGGAAEWTRTYRWVLSDPLGSGLAVLDETGLVLAHTRFKPFGAVDGEYEAAPDPQRRRFFAGHPQQQETGLHQMSARWMDPETGTFLSVDPVVASASDPQSLNAYAYARNNPVNLTDPNGMCVAMFACGMIVSAPGLGNLTTISTTSTLQFADKAGNVLSSSSLTWTTYSVNGAWAGSASSGVSFGPSSGAPSQSGVTSGASSTPSSGSGFFGAIGQAASAVGGALARVGSMLGWDLALAFQGLVGNLYGLARGLLTTLAGIATLNPSMIGNGLSETFSALVPRYGFWSGPGWGQPNLEANGGNWYGPFSNQSVIEQATYRHDQDHEKPGADRALIRDVWSRHDIGPYGQVYRVGLTALFGAGIGLGSDG